MRAVLGCGLVGLVVVAMTAGCTAAKPAAPPVGAAVPVTSPVPPDLTLHAGKLIAQGSVGTVPATSRSRLPTTAPPTA
jgi:hypothetical protein